MRNAAKWRLITLVDGSAISRNYEHRDHDVRKGVVDRAPVAARAVSRVVLARRMPLERRRGRR